MWSCTYFNFHLLSLQQIPSSNILRSVQAVSKTTSAKNHVLKMTNQHNENFSNEVKADTDAVTAENTSLSNQAMVDEADAYTKDNNEATKDQAKEIVAKSMAKRLTPSTLLIITASADDPSLSDTHRPSSPDPGPQDAFNEIETGKLNSLERTLLKG